MSHGPPAKPSWSATRPAASIPPIPTAVAPRLTEPAVDRDQNGAIQDGYRQQKRRGNSRTDRAAGFDQSWETRLYAAGGQGNRGGGNDDDRRVAEREEETAADRAF